MHKKIVDVFENMQVWIGLDRFGKIICSKSRILVSHAGLENKSHKTQTKHALLTCEELKFKTESVFDNASYTYINIFKTKQNDVRETLFSTVYWTIDLAVHAGGNVLSYSHAFDVKSAQNLHLPKTDFD